MHPMEAKRRACVELQASAATFYKQADLWRDFHHPAAATLCQHYAAQDYEGMWSRLSQLIGVET